MNVHHSYCIAIFFFALFNLFFWRIQQIHFLFDISVTRSLLGFHILVAISV